MTFYEAALEILRREGKPLHFDEITHRALEHGLLSHVGRVPTDIMRARLLAMARRDDGKGVAIVEPGVFGLTSWGIEQDPEALESTEPTPMAVDQKLRPNERTPMTLAERRAAREAERCGRFEAEDKEARARARRRRRRPKKGETAADALAAIVFELGGGPIDLQYVVDGLPRQPSLPKGFPEDLEGLRSLAEAENERREKEGESPRFRLDGDRIDLEPEPAKKKERKKEPKASERGEPPSRPRASSHEEAAGTLLDALRKLSPEPLERLLLELAGRHSLEDAKVAKRSAKGSPLFTGMVGIGVTHMRVAVRMLLSGREVRADDVDELRGDLENYSAAAGVLLGLGKVPRAVRNRAEDMSQKPVILLDGEAVALACAKAGLGIKTRLEEVVEVDPALLESFETNDSSEEE